MVAGIERFREYFTAHEEQYAIIDEKLLIPLKARAFLDLTARSHAGHKVDGKSIRKHCNDVFRLVQLLRSDASITLPEPIRFDLQTLWTKLRLTTRWIPQRLIPE